MDKAYKRALQKIEHAYTKGAIELDLRDNQLSSLPPEIGKLLKLPRLDLSRNQLSSLPPEIGKLQNLTKLNLSENQLSSLPPEIGNLQKLTKLNLSGNQLSSLPPEIAKLQKLTWLDLSYNQLSSLPPEIVKLQNLPELYLHGNQLSSLPPEIAKLQKLTKLDLSGNQLSSLPPEIVKLLKLTELYLSSNQLSSLPPEIVKLQNLTYLSLSSNQLSSLPPEIGKLQKLARLDLSDNQLSSLPPEIGKLQKLARLDLSDNQLSSLPPEIAKLTKLRTNSPWMRKGLELQGNKFNLPIGISNKPPQELIQYILDWQKGKEQSIHEAKVIFIGTGEVGKTSLINMLTKGHYNKDELKTEGIDITDWEIQRREDKIRLHLWDFGGQEIMHATHKFFMTKRSLYLLVTNPRTEDRYGETDIDYWMKLIQSYAGEGVPVIVVINKCENHTLDLGKGSLQDRYPQIKAFIDTSCATGIGIKELKKAITEVINSLPHIDETLPKSYFDIKEQLENDNRDYISYGIYQTLCKEVDEEFQTLSMKILIELLHDLGIMLNFRDKEEGEEISETQVLNPAWITKGVYAIINAAKLIKQKGIMRFEDIREILDQQYVHEELKGNRIIRGVKKWLGMAKPPKKELAYPTSIEKRLIKRVMRQFELAYKIPDKTALLIPGALSEDKPDIQIAKGDIRFRYVYDTMPSSIMSRFIVRMHHLVLGEQLWRHGIVLEEKKCRAYVHAIPTNKHIYIEVLGEGNRRGMLHVIQHHFEAIHKSLAAIGLEEEIYIQRESKGKLCATWYSYEDLLVAEEEGVQELFISKLRGHINVKQILEGVRFPRVNLDHLKETEKVHLLFLSSTPDKESILRVTEEFRDIKAAIRSAKYRDRFGWENCHAVRSQEFRQQILWHHPQVVHFAGHGKISRTQEVAYAKSVEKAGIILESQTRKGRFVSGKNLSGLFREFQGVVECVILNACYSEGVADIIKDYVPYVIGVSGKVKDRTAIAFAAAFYEALGEGRGVKKSFSYACASLGLESRAADMFHLIVGGYRERV